MPKVELVFEASCPFVDAARRNLAAALRQGGWPEAWTEWETTDVSTPLRVRSYGSPTILVDGKDVAGGSAEETSQCCRIYSLDVEERGAPPMQMIVAGLSATKGPVNGKGLLSGGVTMLPTLGSALLPKLTCPICWPAYAGLLSSIGLGFIDYTPYLLPLTMAFLVVSVGMLAYKARRRRGFGPFFLGMAAGVAVLASKFLLESDDLMYASLAVLIGASVWNSWSRSVAPHSKRGDACFSCASEAE